MDSALYDISVPRLLLALTPVLIVCGIYFKWSLGAAGVIYAMARMFLQLVAIGYALVLIFKQSNVLIILAILTVMLLTASWISVRSMKQERLQLFPKAAAALFLGCVPVLFLMIKEVIVLTPWNNPKYLIPLSGMIFANAMNSLSLAADRFQSDILLNQDIAQSRKTALKTALIPITNTFFAVGLVSLPGIMTGQILSGISPLVAVRYQIMIMAMIFGASGISAAVYLYLQKPGAKIAG